MVPSIQVEGGRMRVDLPFLPGQFGPQQVPVASRLSVATDSTGAVVTHRPPIITSPKWHHKRGKGSLSFLFAF